MKESQLFKTFQKIKESYPDALLLFRVGDFYETFNEDAVTISQTLGIVLTKTKDNKEIHSLAGFPFHSLDLYLSKLVRSGHRVAICEQLEEPKKIENVKRKSIKRLDQ